MSEPTQPPTLKLFMTSGSASRIEAEIKYQVCLEIDGLIRRIERLGQASLRPAIARLEEARHLLQREETEA